VAGLASYAFIQVATNALGKHDVKPITSLWFATFALAPGFFLPLEQELGRALSHRRAHFQGGRPVFLKVRLLAVALCALVVVAILALSPFLVKSLFGGHWILVVALLMAFASYAPAHLARGIASGSGRFRAYAIVMGADGAVRIALCATLAALGVKTVGPYGFAVALGPLPGVLWVYGRGNLRTTDGPAAQWQEVTPNLGWLLLGSVCAAGLVNAGPLAADLLKDETQRALVKRLMVLVLGVGVVGTTGAFVLGPFILDKVFNVTLTRKTLAMLALGSALYMIALALAQAVIALKGHALVALGWGLGMVTFVVVTWLSSDQLFPRVEIGLVASSLAALLAFAVALRSRLRSGDLPSGQSVMEALTDMPLET
jgi:hypothetical protein